MARIIVGRMDNNTTVDVAENTTILSALAGHGYRKAENEVIQDLDGNEYNGDEEVTQGVAYFLVQRIKSGSQ